MNIHFLKKTFLLSALLSTGLIQSESNTTRAFFPDIGYTCCSIVPGLICSLAESIIVGVIFPSCPCSVTCRLDPALLDGIDTVLNPEADSIEKK